MSERRAPRLALEVAFLAALATASKFAGLRAYEVAGVMLLGWVFAAVFEWGALRSRAHYGSGLPPRWYMPHVSLPPPRPLEQVAVGYPAETGSDEPTWIASPAMLADWPVAEEPAVEPRAEEETQVHDVLDVDLSLALFDTWGEVPPELGAPEAPDVEVAAEPDAALSKTSRHRIDPLGEVQSKPRRFGRRVKDETVYVEVASRPRSRLLPSAARNEDY